MVDKHIAYTGVLKPPAEVNLDALNAYSIVSADNQALLHCCRTPSDSEQITQMMAWVRRVPLMLAVPQNADPKTYLARYAQWVESSKDGYQILALALPLPWKVAQGADPVRAMQIRRTWARFNFTALLWYTRRLAVQCQDFVRHRSPALNLYSLEADIDSLMREVESSLLTQLCEERDVFWQALSSNSLSDAAWKLNTPLWEQFSSSLAFHALALAKVGQAMRYLAGEIPAAAQLGDSCRLLYILLADEIENAGVRRRDVAPLSWWERCFIWQLLNTTSQITPLVLDDASSSIALPLIAVMGAVSETIHQRGFADFIPLLFGWYTYTYDWGRLSTQFSRSKVELWLKRLQLQPRPGKLAQHLLNTRFLQEHFYFLFQMLAREFPVNGAPRQLTAMESSTLATLLAFFPTYRTLSTGIYAPLVECSSDGWPVDLTAACASDVRSWMVSLTHSF